jgi:membrane-bound lytic murein transglycosylase D
VNFFSSDRGKRMIAAGLRRAGRYRQMIERVLNEEGVPQELIYLAQAESGSCRAPCRTRPPAGCGSSSRGAVASTDCRSRRSPMNVSIPRKQRARPRSTFATYSSSSAIGILRWRPTTAARAAWIAPFNVPAMLTSGRLSRMSMLPKQTQNYVPVIVAITIVAKNAKDYGLDDVQVDQPILYDSVTIDSATNLMLVADALERPIAEIRELNPGLLKSTAPAGYELRVPKGSAHALIAALDAVPAARRASWRMHRVERGETIDHRQAVSYPACRNRGCESLRCFGIGIG